MRKPLSRYVPILKTTVEQKRCGIDGGQPHERRFLLRKSCCKSTTTPPGIPARNLTTVVGNAPDATTESTCANSSEPSVHCFLQCTRPIHSARRLKPPTAAIPGTRCTGSVCRLSAAKSDSSSEESPSAAGAANQGSRCQQASTIRFPTGCLAQGQNAPQPFRSCFQPIQKVEGLVNGSSLRSFADGSRLPCRASCTQTLAHTCLSLRSKHRWRFRASSNQATLPHYGFSCDRSH